MGAYLGQGGAELEGGEVLEHAEQGGGRDVLAVGEVRDEVVRVVEAAVVLRWDAAHRARPEALQRAGGQVRHVHMRATCVGMHVRYECTRVSWLSVVCCPAGAAAAVQ